MAQALQWKRWKDLRTSQESVLDKIKAIETSHGGGSSFWGEANK